MKLRFPNQFVFTVQIYILFELHEVLWIDLLALYFIVGALVLYRYSCVFGHSSVVYKASSLVGFQKPNVFLIFLNGQPLLLFFSSNFPYFRESIFILIKLAFFYFLVLVLSNVINFKLWLRVIIWVRIRRKLLNLTNFSFMLFPLLRLITNS